MKTKTRTSLLFISGLLLMLFAMPQSAMAGMASGGLWATYSNYLCAPSCGDDEADQIRIENINFHDFDLHLQNVLGNNTEAYVVWKGFIYADVAGDYDFQLDIGVGSYNNGLTVSDFSIDNHDYLGTSTTGTDRTFHNIHLDTGWNRMYVNARVRVVTDSNIQVRWRPPSAGSYTAIPDDHLAYYYWSDDMAVIPSTGKGQFDFVTAAAGKGMYFDDGAGTVIDQRERELEIEIQITDESGTPVPESRWMKDDVWIVWFTNYGDPPSIKVTNEKTGQTYGGGGGFDGTECEAIFDAYEKYSQTYRNLPSDLIDNGGDTTLHLKFEKIGGATNDYFNNGVAIVVPFEDLSRPNGNLVLKFANLSAYHSFTPTVTFPVNGNEDTTIDPIFLLEDGETKRLHSYTTGRLYRPNYIYALSGSGSYPSVDKVLKHDGDAEMIVPQRNKSTATFDIDNRFTWYPDFGRESSEIDILSSKYRPNRWAKVFNQYRGGHLDEGHLDPITIATTDTWIAFQYSGSNFPEDGLGPTPPESVSGESGSLAMIGVYTTEHRQYDLKVAVNGDGSVTSDVGSINCPGGDCTDSYDDQTLVKLTAAPNAPANFLGWGGECLSAGTNLNCFLVMDEDILDVVANFENPVPIDGECGYACDTTHCEAPTEGFCQPPSTMSAAGVIETPTGWEWVCEGINLGLPTNPPCQVEKQCGWVER